ncbi:MAG: YidC/Oxa1 family membrane protein insertase [Ilumatobacteraceae bacterium]|nr:membrane protein insertase YidC [Gammaproteobacteria bacterium]
MFELAARLIAAFYAWTHSYSVAIGLVAIVVMLIITPLTLKSTKGMLEMQRLQPEMRRLQTQFKGDRQQLNAEMMKLYQEHKVNPLASCLPLLAQMPVFIIMFRALSGLGNRVDGLLAPKYLNETSELFISLNGKAEMRSFGLDLSITPQAAVQDSFGKGLIYVVLVAALAALYFVQQRMVASRTVSPTMSATQAKIMQYLPVVFAVFQLFLPTSLVVYYIVQAIVRIVQQYYITKRFYGNDDSLGRQAQAASAKARDIAENDKQSKKDTPPSNEPFQSKRVTPRKGSESSQVSRRPQAPGKNRTGSLDRKKKK